MGQFFEQAQQRGFTAALFGRLDANVSGHVAQVEGEGMQYP